MSSTSNGHPNFHGSRDFYEAINIFIRNIVAQEGEHKDKLDSIDKLERLGIYMMIAITRCFSGRYIGSEPSEKLIL